METLSRHVGESKLPAGVLHSWSRPQPFSRTSNKKKKSSKNSVHKPTPSSQPDRATQDAGQGNKGESPSRALGLPPDLREKAGGQDAIPLLQSSTRLFAFHCGPG